MRDTFKRFLQEETAAATTEYILIVAGVALAVATAAVAFKDELIAAFGRAEADVAEYAPDN